MTPRSALPAPTLGVQRGQARAAPAFTYSHVGQSAFRRNLIRSVEWMSGQPTLVRLYSHWAEGDQRPGETVFDAALRLLGVTPQIAGLQHLSALPHEGGLLIVANHPFGILDGLAIGQLGLRLRGNVRILTHRLLCRVPEVDPFLLPVDFADTAQARRLTGETRRQAGALLAAGQVVAIFPAGSVATANQPLRGRAVDPAWHPFVGRLAALPGVTTLPVHVQGQNSRLFQIASHLSYPLRAALIFHETRRRMGRPVHLTLGAPIAADRLRALDRPLVAETLRQTTMALSDPPLPDPAEVFRWPSYIRW